ncbi:MAG TPA: large-conductance mechanosensitive channel protein MscL [bacterium]|jgi:large conductance mechanosensitive channel|nr:large-conductance mechanosensitive channel protein MscL [bacterium]HNZ52643.1 large-conductance mechanosensitive channel protein MscL [bacterium]HOB71254.1 large-conductance mechanosensitive channel protein MscL [bacterium]HOG44912.1 large-conductance mechanosensitive channel protein MscL [bacterium]HQB08453.1 large-conductance mechanosensitive channel protein MscL [bacterium]
MKIINEFKTFAMRGNVIDMAVGIIIGAAFGKIVTSIVGDVIMPVIGLFVGGLNFTTLQFTVGESVIKYGNFIQVTFDFTIVAFAIFMLIKGLNSLKKKEEAAPAPAEPPAPPADIVLLTEIRDLLKK